MDIEKDYRTVCFLSVSQKLHLFLQDKVSKVKLQMLMEIWIGGYNPWCAGCDRWRTGVRGVRRGAVAARRGRSRQPRANIPRERCLPVRPQPLMQYSTLLRPCNAVIHYNKFNRCEVIFIIFFLFSSLQVLCNSQGHFGVLNYLNVPTHESWYDKVGWDYDDKMLLDGITFIGLLIKIQWCGVAIMTSSMQYIFYSMAFLCCTLCCLCHVHRWVF